MPRPEISEILKPRKRTVKATILSPSEGTTVISFRLMPHGPVTVEAARWIARQIIQAANAADQGEVGTYPQEGL